MARRLRWRLHMHRVGPAAVQARGHVVRQVQCADRPCGANAQADLSPSFDRRLSVGLFRVAVQARQHMVRQVQRAQGPCNLRHNGKIPERRKHWRHSSAARTTALPRGHATSCCMAEIVCQTPGIRIGITFRNLLRVQDAEVRAFRLRVVHHHQHPPIVLRFPVWPRHEDRLLQSHEAQRVRRNHGFRDSALLTITSAQPSSSAVPSSRGTKMQHWLPSTLRLFDCSIQSPCSNPTLQGRRQQLVAVEHIHYEARCCATSNILRPSLHQEPDARLLSSCCANTRYAT